MTLLNSIEAKIDFLKKYHIPFELLTRTALNSRFPGFLILDHMIGPFQPQAGFLYIDDCILYFVNTSLCAGAQILTNERLSLGIVIKI